MKTVFLNYLMITLMLTMSCQNLSSKSHNQVSFVEADSIVFYANLDNEDVLLYNLVNDHMEVSITNFGARIVSLKVKDKNGEFVDVVLGYDTAEEYISNTNNFYGAVVGRYGNRIGNATFTLNGTTYELEKNNGGNMLHGGKNGVYNKVWTVKSLNKEEITLEYISPDKEAGFPGNVRMTVKYILTKEGGLQIEYDAVTDKETVLNLTNHAYFNLSGAGDTTILDHELRIDADQVTEVTKSLIPTGKSLKVQGTPFDFTKSKAIGADINKEHMQLKYGKGYDHNFELNKKDGFENVATLYSPKSGIEMTVFTTEPGLQFYSGNFMRANDPKGKAGKSYPYRSALCLETQHFPDSPNHPHFPSTLVVPGKKYISKTEYRFSVK